MSERRVLVIEDEQDIADVIAMNLRDLPAQVAIERDGLGGLQRALAGHWDLIVLDLRLPGLGGLDLCRELRRHDAQVPVLMLTARTSEVDRVLGLELGADDYLGKPFGVLELQARAKALMRRANRPGIAATVDSGGVQDAPILHGELKIDRGQRRAWLASTELVLTPREFDLLWHFMRHPARVFTRSHLLADVWGYGHDGYDHTVNSHINRLRTKIGDDRVDARYIHTVWGVGYRFEAKW